MLGFDAHLSPLFRTSKKPLTQRQITTWLRSLRGNSFNPSSNFDVTSVIRVKYSGDDSLYYFAGVNNESRELRESNHGEEGAISAMATAFGKNAEILEVWVMGAPKHLKPGDKHPLAKLNVTCCGKCRQQLAGFADPGVIVHSISLNGHHQKKTLGDLLPDVFSFKQFTPDALQPSKLKDRKLSELDIERRMIRSGKKLSEKEIIDWLDDLESVDHASQVEQAVVIKLSDNNYVAGVKVEEAAYLSINPIQNAASIANLAVGKVAIEEVWSLSKAKEKTDINENHHWLTLPAIQILAQYAKDPNIKIHMHSHDGKKETIRLHESAKCIPIFPKPMVAKDNKQRPLMTLSQLGSENIPNRAPILTRYKASLKKEMLATKGTLNETFQPAGKSLIESTKMTRRAR